MNKYADIVSRHNLYFEDPSFLYKTYTNPFSLKTNSFHLEVFAGAKYKGVAGETILPLFICHAA